MARSYAPGDQRTRLVRMISGYRNTLIIAAAVRLGIPDRLDAPRNVEELASATSTHAPSLLRLLRALVVLGVVEQVDGGRFALTAFGGPLRTDAGDTVVPSVLSSTGLDSLRVWAELRHSVQTGGTAFEYVHGISAFDFFDQHPAINASFNATMAAGTRLVAPAIIAAFDFSRFGIVADIGGGNGTLLAEILGAHPNARGVLFDSQAGLEAAPETLNKAGVADRCQPVTGDFFQSVPPGADVYILKHIIHDWNDEQAVSILRNVRDAMADAGRLLLIEGVMPDVIDTSGDTAAVVMADINMLLNTGGRERTLSEFESLFASSGFRLAQEVKVDAPYPMSVIEGVPA